MSLVSLLNATFIRLEHENVTWNTMTAPSECHMCSTQARRGGWLFFFPVDRQMPFTVFSCLKFHSSRGKVATS